VRLGTDLARLEGRRSSAVTHQHVGQCAHGSLHDERQRAPVVVAAKAGHAVLHYERPGALASSSATKLGVDDHGPGRELSDGRESAQVPHEQIRIVFIVAPAAANPLRTPMAERRGNGSKFLASLRETEFPDLAFGVAAHDTEYSRRCSRCACWPVDTRTTPRCRSMKRLLLDSNWRISSGVLRSHNTLASLATVRN
jgi:hypothetical protein